MHIFQCGAVGLGAITAAKSSAYSRIVAIDIHSSRLEVAKLNGATHTINASEMNNIPEALLEIGGLVDCVIEATGVAQISTTGYQCLDRGGTLAIVGLAKPGETRKSIS